MVSPMKRLLEIGRTEQGLGGPLGVGLAKIIKGDLSVGDNYDKSPKGPTVRAWDRFTNKGG